FPEPAPEAAVVLRRAVLVVLDRDAAGDDGRDAGVGRAQAVVGIFEVTVEDRIERADAVDAVAADVRERERDALHAPRRGELADLALYGAAFGLLAPERVGLDEAASVVDAAFGFGPEQAAADDAGVGRRVRRVAQAIQPVALRELQVVVEE